MKRPDTYDYHWSKTGETLKNPPYNNTRYSADQDKYIDYLEAQIKSQESDSLPIVSNWAVLKTKIMNKEKLKHLPFNFFWCASSFILPFFILTEMAQMNTLASIGIALYIYLLDVKGQTDTDYLSEKIKKLEDAEK